MKTRYKSAILTTAGYFIGICTQLIVFPLYGINVNISDTFILGFIFMSVSFCTNFCSLKIIDYITKRKGNK